MAKQKYYVVWEGRKTGIFTTWEDCSAQVTGYTGAQYKAFENRALAEIAFTQTYANYKGKNTHISGSLMQALINPPIAESYCVDASCIGNPGLMEYRCVHTTSGKELFHQGPFPNGTNNIGEFLAIVHALALFAKQDIRFPLYSDSETAIAWVKNKKCKSNLARDKKNEEIFQLIERAESWLQENEFNTVILKWDTNAWGEIPADYGRK